MRQEIDECGGGGSNININNILRALMLNWFCRIGCFYRHIKPVRLRVAVEVPATATATATAAASYILLLPFTFVTRSDLSQDPEYVG
ncbi:unnamed protein product, partial [Mycena citricolor]